MENATKRIRKMRRQGNPGTHGGPVLRVFRQREHFLVALDRARLRIYRERRQPGQDHTQLELVEAIDFPEGFSAFTERDTDAAGRFPGSKGGAGMSIDERLPMLREYERRRANDLAAELDSFLAKRPYATWDLAAGPTICRAVLGRLSRESEARLRRSVMKDVVKQPPAAIHFPAA